jgi:nucleoside-diphosphate-sugar epimerase
VLVTGASGWLGTALLQKLYASDDGGGAETVRCLVPRGLDASPLTALSESVDIATGDLRDTESLRDFCRRAEGSTLFHVAGVIHPKRTREFDQINVEGTRALLTAAREAGVKRVVVVSSNSAIGCNPRSDHVFDEESPYDPYLGYGRSKAEMERIVTQAQAGGDIEAVIVRAPWFYGPHQPARQTQFFRMIRAGRFPILGDGRQRRSMAYVDNLCQGLLLAAVVEAAAGQTYWIADERPYSMNEIVDTVEDVLENDFGIHCSHGRLRLPAYVGRTAQAADGFLQALGLYEQRIHVLGEMDKTIACSIEKAVAELGYAPRFSLRDGMVASVRWCLENGQHL